MNNVSVLGRTNSLDNVKVVGRRRAMYFRRMMFFSVLCVFGMVATMAVAKSDLNYLQNRSFANMLVTFGTIVYTVSCFFQVFKSVEKL